MRESTVLVKLASIESVIYISRCWFYAISMGVLYYHINDIDSYANFTLFEFREKPVVFKQQDIVLNILK
jgi:hypothetical protein